MNTISPIKVILSEQSKVVYERKSWFIFSWYERVRRDVVGNDLYIISDREIANVYLNGKQLK